MAKVTGFKVSKIVPKVPREMADLLPQYPSEEISFRLSGATNAIANAFRRCPEELLAKYLACNGSDVITNDEYIINDFIAMRVKSIPLQQSIQLGTTWELSAVNNTTEIIDIMTNDINVSGTKVRPFNNCVLCTLNPGRQLYIKGVVNEAMSYIDGSGMVPLASLCSSTVVDVDSLPNSFEGIVGTPSRQANRMDWLISMVTPGHIDANKLMTLICDNIIARAKNVKRLEIISTKDLHELVIIGETHTIGTLLSRECENIKDIKFYSNKPDPTSFGIRFEMRCDSDPKVILDSMLDSIVHKFEGLRSQF